MRKIILALFLWISSITLVFCQDRAKKVLELKNGTTVSGYIMEQKNGDFMLETETGDIIFYTRNEILSVKDPNKTVQSAPSARSESHTYVDMGLSVKWASCNVGAAAPSEGGSYFAWGEISAKEKYDWDNYKWCNGNNEIITKYNRKGENNVSLELSDDAAYYNWGGDWRMPTWEEWEELMENCRWRWTSLDDVKGYEVTSKKNGNTIFLPAAGYYDGSSARHENKLGRYWSSSLYVNYPTSAQFLVISKLSKKNDTNDRCQGLSVRPVKE